MIKQRNIADSRFDYPDLCATLKSMKEGFFISNVGAPILSRAIDSYQTEGSVHYSVGIPFFDLITDESPFGATGATEAVDHSIAGATLRFNVLCENPEYSYGNLHPLLLLTMWRCYMAGLTFEDRVTIVSKPRSTC